MQFLEPPASGALSLASLRIRPGRHRTALGHEGFQLSSDAAGRSLAVHTSSGEFYSSATIGSKLARVRFRNNCIIAPTQLPFQLTPYYLPDGSWFKYKKLKSGRHGILARDRHGKRALIVKQDGYLHILIQGGPAHKIRLGKIGRSERLLDPRTAFNATIDNHGIWTGDEDFALLESRSNPMGDVRLQPDVTICSQDSSDGNCDTGGDSGGDSGGGDSGGGDIGGGGGGGDGGGGDGGGDGGGKGGKNSPSPDPSVSCSGGSQMTHQCWEDLEGLAAAVLIAIGGGIGGLALCFTGGIFTFGVACWAAILVEAGSCLALAQALQVWQDNDCPDPTKTRTC